MSKLDWGTAPEDAQFYSFGRFCKHVDEKKEYVFYQNRWRPVAFYDMKMHRSQHDFEMRPVPEETSAGLEVKSDSKYWGGEGLPPVGIECEYRHSSLGWILCTTIGIYKDAMVCAPTGNGGGFYQGSASMYRPVKSDREKWIEQAEAICERSAHGCELAVLYQEMQNGSLPLPEVKK